MIKMGSLVLETLFTLPHASVNTIEVTPSPVLDPTLCTLAS